ncbi:hypothetical protein METBIDRAFT_195059 [Metschnikowia bicuspidata var. bicuspidata NRRL YB-4993]|uniref:Uncharacterized protein n=1 Tax=Metschnikowia bicuspidata var. bicuspidata NRRL YB-4993 TaxID=869754 RepID=A0A1A0H845_9ASCO|nr:hypothetical protein METBIDRAFT_195059 [Metschnikowia bicuspidata var. bicuspidata NRRL YB-4993]OBA20274.1 hypothetical protein METBIDRAFT_195059 [Metschnikowia bicuspidata var. bicuspidata NRRL YB-4993]
MTNLPETMLDDWASLGSTTCIRAHLLLLFEIKSTGICRDILSWFQSVSFDSGFLHSSSILFLQKRSVKKRVGRLGVAGLADRHQRPACYYYLKSVVRVLKRHWAMVSRAIFYFGLLHFDFNCESVKRRFWRIGHGWPYDIAATTSKVSSIGN